MKPGDFRKNNIIQWMRRTVKYGKEKGREKGIEDQKIKR